MAPAAERQHTAGAAFRTGLLVAALLSPIDAGEPALATAERDAQESVSPLGPFGFRRGQAASLRRNVWLKGGGPPAPDSFAAGTR